MDKEMIPRALMTAILGIVAYSCYALLPAWGISLLLLAILSLILLIEWPLFKIPSLTLIYPVFPFLMLIKLNETEPAWLFPLTVLMVATHDTGAYVIGKLFGKHQLAPFISPGKTWEGFIGGTLLSFVVTLLVLRYASITMSRYMIPCIFLINVSALIGDLFESLLKRASHIKDSGRLLFSHGGLLDRFDGLLFAGTLMYFLRGLL
jgi:phosphatidate cytidylyltransferase